MRYDVASNPRIANTASKPGNPHFLSGVGDAKGEAAAAGVAEGESESEGVGVGAGVSREDGGKLILHSSIPPSML